MKETAAAACHHHRCHHVDHSSGNFAHLWPRMVASYRRMGRGQGPGTVIWNSPQRAVWPTVTATGCRVLPAVWSSRLGSLLHRMCTAAQRIQNKHICIHTHKTNCTNATQKSGLLNSPTWAELKQKHLYTAKRHSTRLEPTHNLSASGKFHQSDLHSTSECWMISTYCPY